MGETMQIQPSWEPANPRRSRSSAAWMEDSFDGGSEHRFYAPVRRAMSSLRTTKPRCRSLLPSALLFPRSSKTEAVWCRQTGSKDVAAADIGNADCQADERNCSDPRKQLAAHERVFHPPFRLRRW